MMFAALTASADGSKPLLDKARVLEAQGKHAAAVAAYEAYLQTAPDDATASAELGFAALQAKDLAKAEAATRLAIAHASSDTDAKVRGAALYNLGMIQEAQNASKEAAVSYKESLASRPSRAARERLQKLDAAVAATIDPFAPAQLAGPFHDLADACRDWLVKHDGSASDTWGEHGSCASLDMIAVPKVKLALPFLELVAFEMADRSSLDLGVRTAEGWFMYEYTGNGRRSPAHCGGTTFTLAPPANVSLPLSALHVAYRSQGSCFHREEEWSWDERGTIVIGVGASHVPSASPAPIVTAQTEITGDDAKHWHDTDAKLTVTWNRDGTLDVTGTIHHSAPLWNGSDDLDPELVLGHHVLAFP
jgi:tetratricopeptide (TPR) repeat protein